MSRIRSFVLAFVVTSMLTGSTAFAGGVNFTLIGPPINGITPTGKANVDQTHLQQGDPGTITLEVKNVNLPDNTQLDIRIAFAHIATVTVVNGQGKVQATLPKVAFVFGPDELEVKLGLTDIMVGVIQ